jgi:CRISPR-associated helicase Cas3
VHASSTTPQTGTVYLICTSAGEVGIDMSADHLVCDLTPFDSMAQRFGRVNRFGTGDARIDLVHVKTDANLESGGGKAGTSNLKASKKSELFERARELTLALLQLSAIM